MVIDLYSIDYIYLSSGYVDFRKSIEGLAGEVMNLELSPYTNNLFVFCNKYRDKVKILYWDGTGFWLLYKKLSKGRFKWPANNSLTNVTPQELNWLLNGANTIKPKSFERKYYNTEEKQ